MMFSSNSGPGNDRKRLMKNSERGTFNTSGTYWKDNTNLSPNTDDDGDSGGIDNGEGFRDEPGGGGEVRRDNGFGGLTVQGLYMENNFLKKQEQRYKTVICTMCLMIVGLGIGLGVLLSSPAEQAAIRGSMEGPVEGAPVQEPTIHIEEEPNPQHPERPTVAHVGDEQSPGLEGDSVPLPPTHSHPLAPFTPQNGSGSQTSAPPVVTAFFDDISKMIQTMIPSVNITDESAAQQALFWMMNYDTDTTPSMPKDEILQRFALASFHLGSGCHGGDAYDHSNWLSPTDECNWEGLVCDENHNLVGMEIKHCDKPGYGLPPELGLLTTLVKLDYEAQIHLMSAELHDAPLVPTELGLMTELTFLRLAQVKSHGNTIPTELGKLTNLKKINLDENEFHGSIPTEFGKLTEMKHFRLTRNTFTEGEATIPKELFDMTDLEILDLTSNALSGTLPSEISKVTLLTEFSMSNNQVIGTLPDSFSKLSNLRQFRFFEQYSPEDLETLGGMFPTTMCRHLDLVQVDCHAILIESCPCCTDSHGKLCMTGELPTAEPAIQEGSTMHPTSRMATGLVGILEDVMPDLDYQDPLSSTSVALDWLSNADTVMQDDSVAEEELLQRFALSAFYFATGCQGTAFASLTRRYNWLKPGLHVCDWFGVECNGVDQIDALAVHECGELIGPPRSATIPREIGLLTALTELLINDRMKGDGLGGYKMIPTEIGLLTNLVFLGLNDVPANGQKLPTEIGLLTELGMLNLVETQMAGPLPDQIGQLTKLTTLRIHHAAMTNTTIPTTIGQLTKLQILQLADNSFTGAIPSSIGNLNDLQMLWLSGNHGLTGTVPKLAAMSNLKELRLGGLKELKGMIPDSLCDQLNVAQTDCSADVLCSCCKDGQQQVCERQVAGPF